jgi:hypothetical protein
VSLHPKILPLKAKQIGYTSDRLIKGMI